MTETGTTPTDPNTLVEVHLDMVQHLVNQLASGYPRHIDRSELWSAGAAGLVDASRRYDPDTGVPFARYANIRMRGAIIDSTRSRDWASRRVRRDMRRLASAAAEFEQQHGRAASAGDLAEALGLTAEEVAAKQGAAEAATVLNLDEPVGELPDGDTFADFLPEMDLGQLPEEAIEQQELIGTLRTAVGLLPAVQRHVVDGYFFHGRLLRDLADDLGMTEARVSQLRAEAIVAIRAYFAEAFEDVAPVPASAPGVRRRQAYVAEVTTASTWRSRLEAGAGVPEPVLAGVSAS